jgi:hypothetical protein
MSRQSRIKQSLRLSICAGQLIRNQDCHSLMDTENQPRRMYLFHQRPGAVSADIIASVRCDCAACDLMLPVLLINLQIAHARDIINGRSIGGDPPVLLPTFEVARLQRRWPDLWCCFIAVRLLIIYRRVLIHTANFLQLYI